MKNNHLFERDEAREMRALDAWISRNIFGRADVEFSNQEVSWDADKRAPKNYSTDPAAAMEVLRKCRAVAYVSFCSTDGGRVYACGHNHRWHTVEADTEEMAIALLARSLFGKGEE